MRPIFSSDNFFKILLFFGRLDWLDWLDWLSWFRWLRWLNFRLLFCWSWRNGGRGVYASGVGTRTHKIGSFFRILEKSVSRYESNYLPGCGVSNPVRHLGNSSANLIDV